LFLVGAERSGSTLLRRMLARHPQIAMVGDFRFVANAISPDGRVMKRDAFVRALELDPLFARSRLTIPPGLTFVGIANDFLDQAATPKNATVVGATVHHHFDRLLRLWPDARFIHLVRDGRDVAMSTIPMGWAGNMWRGIREWVEIEELWARLSAKLPIERQITVKYEMLASDPEYELRRITHFLALDFRPEMLRDERGATYSAQPGDSVGKWRDVHPAELGAAEHRAARWLLQNGYVLSGSVRKPSILRRIALRLQDRLAIALHRKSRFGTRLWLASVYTRRFGSRTAMDRLTRQQNEIIRREMQ